MVGQIGDHWLGLLLVWALDCKVFSGSGFVDVVVDDLIRWWCFGCFFFFFCVCLPRKFMGLKAKVCFIGDTGLGLGFGFRVCFFAGD